jgi:uncharacterized Fe-S center protein
MIEAATAIANVAENSYNPLLQYLEGKIMRIIIEKCKKCLECVDVCPVQAISEKDGNVAIDENSCLGCGCCAATCSNAAIDCE